MQRSMYGTRDAGLIWEECGENEPIKTLGLTWVECGDNEPTGRKLENGKLSRALEKKHAFTRKEWEAFGITDLKISDVIKSKAKHFKPASPATAAAATTATRGRCLR